MSMEPKMVAYGVATVDAEGSIDTLRTYNCEVVGTGVGIYTLSLGQGGVDKDLSSISVVARAGAAGGAGTARAPTVVQSSDVTKQLLFTDDAGALADPAGFWFEIKRYPPLPTP